MRKLFGTIAIVFTMLASSFAAQPTGVAQLKGTYSFSISGITTAGGYYTDNNTWHYVNGQCPAKENCTSQTFQKVTVGTIYFNGAGQATFMSITQYDPSGEPNGGGPVKGTVWPYSVTGVTGLIGTEGNGASLTLGAYNSAGLASVVMLLTGDTNPSTGIATLQ
jgi:hypothetical protein